MILFSFANSHSDAGGPNQFPEFVSSVVSLKIRLSKSALLDHQRIQGTCNCCRQF